jgi:hypothetical protein
MYMSDFPQPLFNATYLFIYPIQNRIYKETTDEVTSLRQNYPSTSFEITLKEKIIVIR